MKYGVVYDLKKASEIAALGFDYIEGTVTSVASMSDAEFAELKSGIGQTSICAEAFCVLFPGSIRLTGPDADMGKVESYIDGVFPRLTSLGAQSVVFGSGGARAVPEGFDRAEAWRQLISVGRLLGQKALEHGLVIALEPLRKEETNIVNTQREGLALVKDVAHPGFCILSDYYHLHLGGEGEDEVAECGALLRHAHISDPDGRVCPREGDGANYAEFFGGLARAGYDSRLSYEGKIDGLEELGESLRYIKKTAKACGY